MSIRNRMWTALFIFFNLACTTQPAPSSRIKIGAVLPLTGGQASFGLNARQGIELAVQEYNQSQTHPLRRVELLVLDDQGKSEEAAIALTQLITRSKIVAAIGEISSSSTLAIAPIAQKYAIPLVTPGATHPRVTQIGSFIFRTCFIDSLQGEALAQFVRQDLKLDQVGILHDTKSDYSQGLAESFRRSFVRQGGRIILNQSYGSGDIEFRSQLTALRAARPQGIFIPGSYMEVGLIARQARELGITVPLFGGDSWDSPRLGEIASKAIEGAYFSNHYSSNEASPGVSEFIARYQAQYRRSPDGLAALGYDGTRVLLEAISRSSVVTPENIRIALTQTRNFPGINGAISLDDQRNAIKPISILRISQGQFKFFKSIQPD